MDCYNGRIEGHVDKIYDIPSILGGTHTQCAISFIFHWVHIIYLYMLVGNTPSFISLVNGLI